MGKVIDFFEFKSVSKETDNAEYLNVLRELRDDTTGKAEAGCIVSQLYGAFVDHKKDLTCVHGLRTAASFTDIRVLDEGLYSFTLDSVFAEYSGTFLKVERIPAHNAKVEIDRQANRAAVLLFSHGINMLLLAKEEISSPTAFLIYPVASELLAHAKDIISVEVGACLDILVREDDNFNVRVKFGGWFETNPLM